MLLTARKTGKAGKTVHLGNSKSLFFNRQIKNRIETEEIIKLSEIQKAATRIAPYIKRTPLFHDEDLSARFSSNFYLKHELLQKTGAFKVRGGVNLVGTLSDDDRRRGLVSASTGNHGQSIAYGGRLFASRVVIYAPAENINESKMRAMRELGAEVRLHGTDFDEARQACERAANEEGFRYIHSANETMLIAGVGTMGLEIFEDLPDVDVIIAPAGGGSCASGNCIVANALNPNVRVIAVQSDAAPAMWHAWRNRNLEPHPTMYTEHEGLATRVPFELTNKILWELLSDFVLASDAEINGAVKLLAQHAKQVTEGAGAASLAGALKIRDELRGKKVVGIVSGGNLPLARFASLINH